MFVLMFIEKIADVSTSLHTITEEEKLIRQEDAGRTRETARQHGVAFRITSNAKETHAQWVRWNAVWLTK